MLRAYVRRIKNSFVENYMIEMLRFASSHLPPSSQERVVVRTLTELKQRGVYHGDPAAVAGRIVRDATS